MTDSIARNTIQHEPGQAKRLPERIHLIGIGGSGLSAIARLLLERGVQVSGSDRSLSPLARELAAAGARVMEGHRAENIDGAQLIVRSSAITDDNVEVQAARAAGIAVVKRAEFLGQLMEGDRTVAIAGTHGKTTTTAMVAWMLAKVGMDPSYIIGGTAKNLGGRNAHSGTGKAFVIEADEYDRMFLGLNPDISVVTYLEHDHPDCFPTPELYFEAFVAFVQRLRPNGTLLAAYENPAARRLAGVVPSGTSAFTYGIGPEADYVAVNLVANARGGFDYEAYWQSEEGQPVHLARVSLRVPGEHNVRNSLAALAVMHRLESEQAQPGRLAAAAAALGEFEGTGRRFDVQGSANGITVIDDYAHHPTEIQATLAAARARYPGRRIWAVWQPHTFSRTRALMADFARSFKNADRVIVTEVYAAREKAQDFDNFSAVQVADAIMQPAKGVQFLTNLEESAEYLLHQLQPGDVLLVLSAGDADQISARVLAALKKKEGNAL